MGRKEEQVEKVGREKRGGDFFFFFFFGAIKKCLYVIGSGSVISLHPFTDVSSISAFDGVWSFLYVHLWVRIQEFQTFIRFKRHQKVQFCSKEDEDISDDCICSPKDEKDELHHRTWYHFHQDSMYLKTIRRDDLPKQEQETWLHRHSVFFEMQIGKVKLLFFDFGREIFLPPSPPPTHKLWTFFPPSVPPPPSSLLPSLSPSPPLLKLSMISVPLVFVEIFCLLKVVSQPSPLSVLPFYPFVKMIFLLLSF